MTGGAALSSAPTTGAAVGRVCTRRYAPAAACP
jgi:hypothetical protein